MPPRSNSKPASSNGRSTPRQVGGAKKTKTVQDNNNNGKRKYQELENDDGHDEQGKRDDNSSSGLSDAPDEDYTISDAVDDHDKESELSSDGGSKERPAKSRKTGNKSKTAKSPDRKPKVNPKTKATTKAKSEPESDSGAESEFGSESETSSKTKGKPKANANAKSSSSTSSSKVKADPKEKKAKAKTKTKTATPQHRIRFSTKAKTAAQIAELLEYLLSDKVFDMANPSPKKGYGEVDWAKHTSPANPKTAPSPLPKPGPSSGQKRKAEEKAVPEYMDMEMNNDTKNSNGNGIEKGTNNPKSKSKSAGSIAGSGSGPGLIRYPFSPMTPFQTLVACLLLSKPLSHKLGIRTITTLLNQPFDFGTFSTLAETDDERRREGMWAARTQHKEKTADQLGELVDGVRGLNGEGEEDQLGGIKRAISAGDQGQGDGLSTVQAQQRVGDMLKTLKGIGNVGVSIFLRRIQSQWSEVYPYIDERCLASAKYLGLLGEDLGGEEGAKKLSELLDGDQEGNRGKLTRLLDTLIGLDLEKKLDDVAEKFAS
ncbi:hypothetical protein IAT40_000511 [Kwoniella sp. CBS 6097]